MRIDENTALFWGIGMLAVAGLITLSSHISTAASDSFLVVTGLLLLGGINLIRGLYLHLKPRSKA